MSKNENKYPLIIIGSGPAGLTASIYASRFKVKNLVIGEALGGLAFEAHKVCNFPSETEVKGAELVDKMKRHVEELGASIINNKVVRIEKEDKYFKIVTNDNKTLKAQTVLMAIGTKHRRLGLESEDKFIGKGVSYCATCDAMFYRDKTVAVIGGSNSAHTASLYLAEVANKVYQIYRGDKMRGETVWIDKVMDNKKIELIFNNQVKGLKGENSLEEIILDQPYQGKDKLKIDGLFIEIGTIPAQGLLSNLKLEVNDSGYIKVATDQKTSKAGIWAAGDITDASNNLRQIITASSEGAIAANSIFKYLQE